jgi:hypothetical protein
MIETLQYTLDTKLALLTKLQAKNFQRHFDMFNRHCVGIKQTSKLPNVNKVVFIFCLV